MDINPQDLVDAVQQAMAYFTSRSVWRILLRPVFILWGFGATFVYVVEWVGVETIVLWLLTVCIAVIEGVGILEKLYRILLYGGPYRPFDHLPDEIVSEILGYSVYGRDQIGCMSRSKDFMLPAATLRVSKRFKDITMNSPDIWSIIYIDQNSSFDHLAQRLRHSKAVPLEVICMHASAQSLDPNGEHVKELLLPHQNRIHTIQCSFELAHTLFGLDNGGEGIPKSLKVIRLARGSQIDDIPGGALDLAGISSFVTISFAGLYPGTLGLAFTNLARLCFWGSAFTFQEYLTFLQQQPLLEELSFDQCTIVLTLEPLQDSTLTALHRLRRYQDVNNKKQTSLLLMSGLKAPNLEDLEISHFKGADQDSRRFPLVLKFPSLKRLRVAVTSLTISWIKSSLSSVTELHLSGYTDEPSEARVKLLKNVVKRCTNVERILFEDLPPSHVRRILKPCGSTALRRIGISTELWGLPPTSSHEEFVKAEDDQTWLLGRYDTWFWGFPNCVRYSSWKNLQNAWDFSQEMRNTYASKRISSWGPGGNNKSNEMVIWQRVHNTIRDWAG